MTKRAMTEQEEKTLRYWLGLLCMAALGRRDGDLKICTDHVIEHVNDMLDANAELTGSNK
jgi:hypothetical protein